jgi:hypothetical protein
MNLYEQTFNIIWIIAAIGICLQSFRLKLWDPSGPGSGFITFLAGFILGVVGLLLFISEGSKGSWKGKKDQFWQSRTAMKRIFSILAGLCALAFFMPILGFLLTSIFIMTLMLRVIEPTQWRVVIGFSLVLNVLAYFLFAHLLEIDLPKGFLGI